MGSRCLAGTGGSFRSCRSRSCSLADVQVMLWDSHDRPELCLCLGGHKAREEEKGASDGWSGAGPRPCTGSFSWHRHSKLRFANSALRPAGSWSRLKQRSPSQRDAREMRKKTSHGGKKNQKTQQGRKCRVASRARWLFVLHGAGECPAPAPPSGVAPMAAVRSPQPLPAGDPRDTARAAPHI